MPLRLVAKTDYGDIKMEIINYASGKGKRIGTMWGGGSKTRAAERPPATGTTGGAGAVAAPAGGS